MMSGKDSTDHRDVFTTGIVKLGSLKIPGMWMRLFPRDQVEDEDRSPDETCLMRYRK